MLKTRETHDRQNSSNNILLDKFLFLKHEIIKIKASIEERKAMAVKKKQAIEKEIEKLNFELEECFRFVKYQPGVNPALDSWRSEKERRILSLKQLLWDIPEQLERDLFILERELRELLREYLPLKRALCEG